MDFSSKKNELIMLITQYLNCEITIDSLNKFSWEMIDFFCQESNKSTFITHEDFEKEFWYTIWQIQHLGDSEHEKEGITRKVLSEALKYLKKEIKIPLNFQGNRP